MMPLAPGTSLGERGISEISTRCRRAEA